MRRYSPSSFAANTGKVHVRRVAMMKSPEQMETPDVPKELTGAERRIAKRFKCDGFAEVVVSYSGFLFRGEIVDISEFGCFIKSRARLTLRRTAEAEVRFTLRHEQFSVLARVAAVRPGTGVGFEFSTIEPHIHKSLIDLIEDLSRE
jgi:hypothetical protein